MASLPHALIHCFQRQDEIASKQFLFHRQGEPYLSQAIKDTLPYFLGVTGPAQLRRSAQLRDLRRKLAKLDKARVETEGALEEGLEEALGLLSQAAEAGLVDLDSPPEQLGDALRRLTSVRDSPIPSAPVQAPGHEFDRLQIERRGLGEQLRQIAEQRALASAIAKGGDAAEAEGIEQVVRLQQIHVMPKAEDPECCPICEQELNDPPPAVEQLRASLMILEDQISSVERDRPGLVAIEDELEVREAAIREQMEANRTALESVAASTEAVEAHQMKLDLGAWVRGRIDHFLEKTAGVSDQGLSELDREKERLEAEIGKLENLLDPTRVRADATSVLIGIGRPMTEMARRLGLEHAESSVRVELNRLTVVADALDGAIYMNSSIGSAKNWVGFHLATVLSLQEHIRQARASGAEFPRP